jgi:hypothetical protein
MLSGANASAQNSFSVQDAKIEVSGGYAYTSGDIRFAQASGALEHGWNAGAMFFVTEGVGVNVDVAAHYGQQDAGSQGTANASLYTYMAGLRAAYPVRKIEVSFRLLGGAAHVASATDSENYAKTDVALMFGGGVDVPLGRFGIRAIQFDLLISGVVRTVTPIYTVGAFYRW